MSPKWMSRSKSTGPNTNSLRKKTTSFAYLALQNEPNQCFDTSPHDIPFNTATNVLLLLRSAIYVKRAPGAREYPRTSLCFHICHAIDQRQ